MNRYDESRQLGLTNRLIKPSMGATSERDNDRLAEAAERWLLSRYGLPKPPRSECDIVVHTYVKGRQVRSCADIKWTSYHQGRLLVPVKNIDSHKAKHTKPCCTAYILVTGNPDQPDTMVAQGWAWGFHVITQMQTERLKEPAYGLEQDDPRFRRNIDILLAATFRIVVP